MSSQSGSEYQKSREVSKVKKNKVEVVPEKKNRRSNRKNTNADSSENALPQNIPITDSE